MKQLNYGVLYKKLENELEKVNDDEYITEDESTGQNYKFRLKINF